MALSARRRGSNGLDAWPGYVDALSTLLMVIIFVLLVFVLAQGFLSVALSRQDKALDRLGRELSALSDTLSLERGRSAQLQLSVAQLGRDLNGTTAARDALAGQLATTQRDEDAAATARDQLAAQLAQAQQQGQATAAQLAQAQQQGQATATQLADQQRQRAAQEKLSQDAQAQVALLSRQIAELHEQLQQVSAALDLQQKTDTSKDAQIADLGQKLNVALAAKVEDLQKYRSEFFGRLRDVLANRPGIQVVGDRFVFQSEVLFPAGSADLTPTGQDQIRALANTLLQIAAEIPRDLNWIMRVDGHADRQPVTRGNFTSNWELSTQRAVNVVKLLIASGVPANRLAATGFADNQPLDAGDTPDAYARNRRIELRLTDR